MSDYPQSFRACKLYRETSKAGGTYFAGRWGGAKIALVKTQEIGNDAEEVWALLLSEAPSYKPEEKPAAASGAPVRYVPQTLDDDAVPF